ncbi:MAG: phosphatidylinositol-specific phospholipase C domain-containing protein [Clostridiales bacterium]|nr:phosphatidylinositol-specific phospholipase C domain-containing protein [Clostridiales bacterium]
MDTKAWMKHIDEAAPLSFINIPGTHNSTTQYIPLRYFSRCQNISVAQQLELGVRYLDLRVEHSKGKLKLVHSIIDCKKSAFSFEKLWLDDIIDDCSRFIKENPSETIIMNFQIDDGKEHLLASDVLFERYVFSNKSLWFTENKNPCLKECRGKLILARRTPISDKFPFNDMNSGINFYNSGTDVKNERVIRSVKDGSTAFTAYVQDDFSVPPKVKWFDFVLPCLNEKKASENSLLVNHLSANNGFFSPKITANYVNKRFMGYELKKGGHYGIIPADFITKELSEKIIASN